MRSIKKIPLELIEVEYIPQKMEFGKFYYSEEYGIGNHLCVCGCGDQVPIRIKNGEWSIINKDKLTVSPSLQRRYGCKSHYIITEGIANIV